MCLYSFLDSTFGLSSKCLVAVEAAWETFIRALEFYLPLFARNSARLLQQNAGEDRRLTKQHTLRHPWRRVKHAHDTERAGAQSRAVSPPRVWRRLARVRVSLDVRAGASAPGGGRSHRRASRRRRSRRRRRGRACGARLRAESPLSNSKRREPGGWAFPGTGDKSLRFDWSGSAVTFLPPPPTSDPPPPGPPPTPTFAHLRHRRQVMRTPRTSADSPLST